MSESLFFHRDFYRDDAIDEVAARYRERGDVTLRRGDAGIELIVDARDASDSRKLCDDISNDALRVTASRMRAPEPRGREVAAPIDAPSWWLVAHEPGTHLGNGWTLEAVGEVRDGACSISLRHEGGTEAQVAIHRNLGAPVGVANTDELDFVVMNGGAGSTATDHGVAQVLVAMAARISKVPPIAARRALVEMLSSHAEGALPAPLDDVEGDERLPLAGEVDRDTGRVRFELDEASFGRIPLYDILVPLTERAVVVLRRASAGRIGVEVFVPVDGAATSLDALAEEVGRSLARVRRATHTPLAELGARGANQDELGAIVAELAAADPETIGIGFRPERSPGHRQQRVLNLRGTGACNSDCVFCVEKFDPTHRLMQAADATREQILESAGEFDTLFFASGEPTIHPKLFEYAELARSLGYENLGMSSHFRTFADPAFARRTLEAGFRYFDISLHAADLASQLEVNPIGDGGRSLPEALKGLAVLFRLADAMELGISVTHKIVVSKMNASSLREIVKQTYDRGVRHFILQPVRASGLVELRQSKVALSEAEIVPSVNELLEWAKSLEGAVVKPYGFSRRALLDGAHVEVEQNRVKNVYGRVRYDGDVLWLPETREERPTDGRHWVVVTNELDQSFGFAADGSQPILDTALERGAELPFGCRMGSCGMCATRLLEGKVDQSTQQFLGEKHVQAGFVLLCQAKPCSDVVVRLCDEREIDAL